MLAFAWKGRLVFRIYLHWCFIIRLRLLLELSTHAFSFYVRISGRCSCRGGALCVLDAFSPALLLAHQVWPFLEMLSMANAPGVAPRPSAPPTFAGLMPAEQQQLMLLQYAMVSAPSSFNPISEQHHQVTSLHYCASAADRTRFASGRFFFFFV